MSLRARSGLIVQMVLAAALVGALTGSLSALFLWLLDCVTDFRAEHENIVYALPVAGLAIGLIYERWGQPILAGTSLVIDAVVTLSPRIPTRMAPMVLIGTVLTHVFGGSAGREGTAVQIGASVADWVCLRGRIGDSQRELRRQLLLAGVAGGFGSVFGTPLAGVVFALEFSVVGRLQWRALLPTLVASVVGDAVTRSFGIAHTHYPQVSAVALTPLLLGKWLVFAAAVALTTIAFIELTHVIKQQGGRYLPRLPLRMCVGGVAVVLLWKLVGTSDYLGLGVPMIVRAFDDPMLPAEAFALKLVFTAITVGAGFLGGEVTPLFFVGATLGNVLARVLEIPLELGAGVGLAALFAAAANTPLALTVMAFELLGVHVLPHVAIVCVVAFLLTGRRSIYIRHSVPKPIDGPE